MHAALILYVRDASSGSHPQTQRRTYPALFGRRAAVGFFDISAQASRLVGTARRGFVLLPSRRVTSHVFFSYPAHASPVEALILCHIYT